MDVWLRAIGIVIGSVGGSSGVIALLVSRSTRGNATTRLLMGMAYDRITTLGIAYIERGSVTMDEYEDLQKYFFDPYKGLGGNGTAEQIMTRVSNLPFRSHDTYPEIFHNRDENEGFIHNVRLIHRSSSDASAE